MAISSLAFSSQSLRLTPSSTFTFHIPDKSPYTPANSFRLETRIHDWVQPAAAQTGTVIDLASVIQVRLMGSNFNAPLAITDWFDNFPAGQSNTIYLDIKSRKDFLLRIQRDVQQRALTVEVWNADGTNHQAQTIQIESIPRKPFPGDGGIGGGQTACSLPYVRWYSGLVSPATSPFDSSKADLADWEFEGDLSGPLKLQGKNATYTKSPSFPPFVSQGPQSVFRAGVPHQLNGASSHSFSGDESLTYRWEQLSGPSQLSWDSKTIAQPAIDGLQFGSYKIKLTITGSNGQSSSTIVKYGAVNTNDLDVVKPSAPYIAALFGPMLRLGANPWPYFDTSEKELADFFGNLQKTDYLDVWNTSLMGDISFQKGSARVTGTGTSFKSTFCSGTNKPDGSSIVIWYPLPADHNQTGRRAYAIAACESDTVLVLGRPYITSASATNTKYARMTEGAVGTWTNGSTNANYYDNVLAFYSLYYRSGIDDYLMYARTLADRWWTQPWVDQGRACSDGDGATCLFPRVQSVTGLVARALDGRPDMWPGLRALIGSDAGWMGGTPLNHNMVDVRESAYCTAFVSLAALFDPDPAKRVQWKALVDRLVSKHWEPGMLPTGIWANQSFGNASWNGAAGTVTVTQGSTKVIGDKTQWQPTWFAGNAFWTASNDAVTGDAIAYTATVISPTELKLNIPYQGPSASGRAWEVSNIVGLGTQPFMLGVLNSAFRYAYLATADPRIARWIGNIASWLSTEGYRKSTRGLWYGRGFPNCEPISDNNGWCSGGNAEQSRFLAGEILGGVSAAYMLAPSPKLKAFGDGIYSAMFAKFPKDPGYDGTYVNDFDGPASWDYQTRKAKDFGFIFGFGQGASWPAARLGAK